MSSIKPILAFVLVLLLTSAARAGTGIPLDPSVTHEVMIRIGAAFTLEQFIPQLIAHNPNYDGVKVLESIDSRNTHLLLFPGLDEEAVGIDLQQAFVDPTLLECVGEPTNPLKPLKWAEANYLGRAAEGKTSSVYVSQFGVGPTQFLGQYAGDLLGLPSAHTASTGVGTVVAVLDTGVQTSHPALEGTVLPFGFNFISESPFTGDVAAGTDSDGDGNPDELVGHGTFVAGLIHLVAPDVKILPITVLDSEGIGDAFDIGEGMYFAIDKGAEVINMSLGSTYKSEIFEDAVCEARDLGIVVTAAAGNFNVEEPEEFPAQVSDVLSVASLNKNDIKAPFSNFNDHMFISAPGDSVQMPSGLWDINHSIIGPVPGDEYAIWEGTSFSTALVSGVAALIRSQHPEWPSGPIPLSEIVPQIENILTDTALNIDALNPAYQEMLGAGRVRAGAAVAVGPVAPGLGDLDASGAVNGIDLANLLADWGQTYTSADLNGDGVVGGIDLAILLGNWG
jgi:subtilisin family serine protease